MIASPQNYLGLDVGGRRIGVAVAGIVARLSSPLLTLDRQDAGDIFERIEKLIDEHQVADIVVGLPRGMDGQETGQTAIAREFADELARTCGVVVHMQDEAATSIAAEEELKASGKPYQKGDIDSGAAAIILSDWLASNQKDGE